MACGCHGKSKQRVVKTRPEDQCTVCARKHYDQAYAAHNEYLYTDTNRAYVHGQLRMVVEHTKKANQQAALKVRDLAQLVLLHRDKEAEPLWDECFRLLQEAFHRDYPELRQNG
jgi:hypothetical protein